MRDKAIFFYRMIRDFVSVYLPDQRGASINTIRSYKESLNLLIDFIGESQNTPLSEVNFDSLTRELIESFLLWLETDRKCAVSTRNQRLSALKSFLRYVAGKERTLMALYMNVEAIPKKKNTKVQEIEFFSEAALEAILSQPNRKKKNGQRDLFFLILMYDTGARAQELLDLKLSDIRTDASNPYVVITGKGSKTRLVPIMEKTCQHFNTYVKTFHANKNSEDFLFYIDRKGLRTQMSIDNVEKFVARYGKMAHEICSEVPKHLYPHMLRHSRAMHLYRNGMPLPLVSEWLGHSRIDTTQKFYANADTAMKQEAIEKATSAINPLNSESFSIRWEDDEELLKKLYGLK